MAVTLTSLAPPLLVDEHIFAGSSMSPARNRLDSASTVSTQRPLSFRDRELPPIPKSPAASTIRTNVRPRVRSTDTVRSSSSVTPLRPLSSFLPLQTRSISLPVLLRQKPRILDSLLKFMSWSDFFSLASTCRDCRNLVGPLETKDIVLSRFIPGYREAVRFRDLRRYQDIQISLQDLGLLLVSQSVPLHRYPMHALTCLSPDILPTLEQADCTQRLISLTQAHSRAVLLLQSIVHSSAFPIPPEPREDTQSTLRNPQRPVLRELTFPAPLSYQLTEQPNNPDYTHRSLRSRQPSINSSHIRGHSVADMAPGLHQRQRLAQLHKPTPQDAKSSGSLTTKAKKRLSRLVHPQAPPPPPPAALPRALKYYSGGWRRPSTRVPRSFTQSDDEGSRAMTGSRRTSMLLPNGYTTPMKRPGPNRRFMAVNTSSDSSIDSSPSRSPLSRSSTGDAPLSSPGTPSPSGSTHLSTCQSIAPPPHDLTLATWRARAPILRVFVPCAEMSDVSQNLERCKDQLVESRLWNHLSIGDVVCNLGYVPGGQRAIAGPDDSYVYIPSDEDDTQGQKWLVFDGEYLIPYSPPNSLPISDPLSLPSPFYYTHIMPTLTNPTFILDRLPRFHEGPQMTLVNASTRVKSPHSPNGYAVVKKYMWLARAVRFPQAGDAVGDGEPGEGWMGEWIIEGEGTRESRQALLECFDRWVGVKRELELVREKSGGGRLWFKLLNSYSDHLELP